MTTIGYYCPYCPWKSKTVKTHEEGRAFQAAHIAKAHPRPRDLDKAGTIAMLSTLKDGDKPLEPRDHFFHPNLGRMRVSRVLGWKGGFQLNQRGGKHHFDPIRSLVITAFREGAKRAERINLMPPEVKVKKKGA